MLTIFTVGGESIEWSSKLQRTFNSYGESGLPSLLDRSPMSHSVRHHLQHTCGFVGVGASYGRV